MQAVRDGCELHVSGTEIGNIDAISVVYRIKIKPWKWELKKKVYIFESY